MSFPGAVRQPSTTAPRPNADRPSDYPNTWTVVTGNNTSKCRICEEKLRQTKWSIRCNRCNKLICPHCWSGVRERSGEELLEGWWQNQDGCWCRFPGGLDNKYWPELDARNKRISLAYSGGTKRKAPVDLDQSPTASVKKPVQARMIRENVSEQQTADGDDEDRVFVRQAPTETDGPVLSGSLSFGMTGKQRAALATPSLSNEDGLGGERPTISPRTPTQSQPVTKQKKGPKRQRLGPDAVEHLDGKTTVVVGSGIIGLSIALELAIHAKETETRHKIVVLEVRDELARLASQHCAGVIDSFGLPQVCNELYRISSNAWSDLLSDEALAKKFHFKPNAVVVAKSSDGIEEDTVGVPGWFRPGPEETLHRDSGNNGRM